MPIVNENEWTQFLERYPDAHLLQTAEWGALKDRFGWKPECLVAGENGAQVLFRRLPLGLTLAYIPKGPLGPDFKELLPELEALCRKNRAVFLKIEPDAWEGEAGWEDQLKAHGFQASGHNIQPRRTIMVDIGGAEDEILARMKQKTRYNIRLAGNKDVVVTQTDDIVEFSDMMGETGTRDGFGVHSLEYYQAAYKLFSPQGDCALFAAKYEEEPLAGLMAFSRGARAWYVYGASTNRHRNRMPTYLIQWEAIRWARERGCQEYDLWGVPDENTDELEAQFNQRADGLWGVYRFKRGFGGALRRTAGSWDKVFNPAAYAFYKMIILRGRAAE